MKKLFNSKTKKITSALIAATISMSLLTAAPASAEFGQYDNPTENIEAVTDNIFEIQRKACEAHELLYSSFGWEETYIYPNDFGGDFIDYDTLHIQVTNEEAIVACHAKRKKLPRKTQKIPVKKSVKDNLTGILISL